DRFPDRWCRTRSLASRCPPPGRLGVRGREVRLEDVPVRQERRRDRDADVQERDQEAGGRERALQEKAQGEGVLVEPPTQPAPELGPPARAPDPAADLDVGSHVPHSVILGSRYA